MRCLCCWWRLRVAYCISRQKGLVGYCPRTFSTTEKDDEVGINKQDLDSYSHSLLTAFLRIHPGCYSTF